ncbi:diacylglycerol O-acyltransferase 3 [Typha angustifolia]|uniref:diacylglycerol O-acyltransferase 3 n=1 Tax=Typha angustifolia TaxID=59011 RepID=UPI003C2B804F
MDISGVALRRSQIGFGAGVRCDSGERSVISGRSMPGARGSLRIPARARGGGDFADEGHLKFYASPARCGEKRKEGKKRAKLMKGLTKDLSKLYSMGFSVEAGERDVKGKMISEAAELLLAQLNQMKAQEKEMKKKRKEEKAAMKATRMKDYDKDDTSSSSSSSSSESSDSECEETVNMSCLRTASASAAPQSQGVVISKPAVPQWSPNPPLQTQSVEENQLTLEHVLECSSSSIITSQGCCSGSVAVVEKPMDKIEVCMGGKCKRSGALELMQEFEKKVGIEGAVVGCKCMGKCKEGPNVRVLSHVAEEGSLKLSRNPLCIGVALEDVDTMVADFFGGKDVRGLMAA